MDAIKQARSFLETGKKIFVLTGAGISAESGVPTFRGGGGTPVWRGMPFEQLSSAEMVEKDLPLVWEWFDYRRGKVMECQPNAAHKTLAKVQQSRRFDEFSLVTQNIDGLHMAAEAENVIELHGSLWQSRCLSCGHKQSLLEIPDDERPPVCRECFDSMRPDVILFGEAMPMKAIMQAQEKAESCDICIVIGTSAQVYPAAELPVIAKRNGAKIIEINPEETPLSALADVSVRGKAAETLPLIFDDDDLPNRRLPGNEVIKLAADQTRKEKQSEGTQKVPAPENSTENSQRSKGSFMTSQSHPLRVDFVCSEEFPVLNNLGLTFAPGKKQFGAISGNWDRDLTEDFMRLRDHYHTDTLVSLIEDTEMAELGISNLENECRVHGVELIRFPFPDVSAPPSLKSFAHLIRELVQRLDQQKTVVIHCKGGLGRAGLTAACSIAAASDNRISGTDAVKMVRAARTGTVQTTEQENFVSLFSEYWLLYKARISDQQKSAVKEKAIETALEGGIDNNELGDKGKTREEEPQKHISNLSEKHFLLYWQESSVLDAMDSGHPLDVISSRQLKRVNSGDTVWIVTVDRAGRLILAGRLKVGEIVDYQTAARRLNDTNLWDGGYYALPEESTAEFMRLINLGEFALDLRFESAGADRLTPVDGRINPQQMQSMRELTGESAALMEEIWAAVIVDDENDDEADGAEKLEFFRHVAESEPSAENYYNLGVICDENDLTDEAISSYQKALEMDPLYMGAYYNLGQNYLQTNELEMAEYAFIQAAMLSDDFAPPHFMLGVAYAAQEKHRDCISATQRGLEISPNDPQAHFNIGRSFYALREFEKAVQSFEQTVAFDAEHADAHYFLGKCFRELGEKEREFDAYLQAVEIAPDFIDALFALGTVYAYLTETEEGAQIPYFETGGQLDAEDARIFFHLGLAQLAHGDVEFAREQLDDLRKMDDRLAGQLQFFIDWHEARGGEEADLTEFKDADFEVGNRQKNDLIEVQIDREPFRAKNIPQLYKAVLGYLVEKGALENISLPVATGQKRYILAREPFHPTGKPFMAPVAYKGFFMEAHNNRAAAIAQLQKLVENLGDRSVENVNAVSMAPEERASVENTAEKLDKFQGCLLGGAVGDALGAAIEFESIDSIRRKYGANGLNDYDSAYGRIGAVTDDTQMTLFTAEGLLRAITRQNHKGICHPPTIIYHAYLRWLETQGERIDNQQIKTWVYKTQSWLRDVSALNSQRAPGNSCLSALLSGKMGTVFEPVNNSKGCGGVMRVAPIGLIADDPFGLAVEVAAITHGQPTGYLTAGVLALIVRQIVNGTGLHDAVNHAVYEILPRHTHHEETFAACDKAVKLAQNKTIQPSPETVETLGAGWIAEEALAISIYCSLVYENDLRKALLLAVNHSGDSDSTGAITGNILGALHGTNAIPSYWLERLELRDVITEIAEDLFTGFESGDDWRNKYPGI